MGKFNDAMRKALTASMIGAATLLAPSVALAHHPMGGATPSTLWQGFLSGVGHPMIGLDHFAFVIAAGIASALVGARLLLPAAFIAATIAGCLLAAAGGIALPFAEYAIAASVIAVGVLVMSGRTVPISTYLSLFLVAGLFHGGAYAEAIVGAEATPLGAYLAGFALIQFAIMAAAAWATEQAEARVTEVATSPRLAGAVVAGVGMTFFVENAEKLLFPGM